MRKLLITAALLTATALTGVARVQAEETANVCVWAPEAECTDVAINAAIETAIAAAVEASAPVRAAFTIDVCIDRELLDSFESRKLISAQDAAAYDAIGILLAAAYAMVPPTDAELEGVRNDFCNGLMEQD